MSVIARPRSLPDAFDALDALPAAQLLAGGTDFMVEVNFGHRRPPAVVAIGPRCFVTPGHLRAEAPGGRPPTFAIADVRAAEVALTIYSAAGAEERCERAPLAGGASKLSVR